MTSVGHLIAPVSEGVAKDCRAWIPNHPINQRWERRVLDLARYSEQSQNFQNKDHNHNGSDNIDNRVHEDGWLSLMRCQPAAGTGPENPLQEVYNCTQCQYPQVTRLDSAHDPKFWRSTAHFTAQFSGFGDKSRPVSAV